MGIGRVGEPKTLMEFKVSSVVEVGEIGRDTGEGGLYEDEVAERACSDDKDGVVTRGPKLEGREEK